MDPERQRKRSCVKIRGSVVSLDTERKGKTPDKRDNSKEMCKRSKMLVSIFENARNRNSQMSINKSQGYFSNKESIFEPIQGIKTRYLSSKQIRTKKQPLNISLISEKKADLKKTIKFYQDKIKDERNEESKAELNLSRILRKHDYGTTTEVMKSMAEVIHYNRKLLRQKIMELSYPSTIRKSKDKDFEKDFDQVRDFFKQVPEKSLIREEKQNAIKAVKRIRDYQLKVSRSVESLIPRKNLASVPRKNQRSSRPKHRAEEKITDTKFSMDKAKQLLIDNVDHSFKTSIPLSQPYKFSIPTKNTMKENRKEAPISRMKSLRNVPRTPRDTSELACHKIPFQRTNKRYFEKDSVFPQKERKLIQKLIAERRTDCLFVQRRYPQRQFQ
ncbi:unnamed protein product [Moneuplotes crassus]|uniref:Uncharacterized protein n=1 Tax=Euplotes crassus TaxID=5936 RepID=A0AAD1UNK3_EUPCR|nr:unnamed protein product [Moneuplotes crassus]